MENGEIPIRFMKRFLDDIFLIIFESIKKLHLFFDEINQLHPNIKFRMSHTKSESEKILHLYASVHL